MKQKRPVNLNEILKHELLPVPLALAEMNGSLRTGTKAIFADVLLKGVQCPTRLPEDMNGGTLIIDGQALIVSLGKPPKAIKFGDLADIFVQSVLSAGEKFEIIHILFDRYYTTSIKDGTRNRRGKMKKAIRRLVTGRDTPLPADWVGFLSLSENKVDLAKFLSNQLLIQAPPNKTLIVAGGFSDETQAESSSPGVDVHQWESRHEEADTRIMFHCVKDESNVVVVAARDTDILILLLAHFDRMSCQYLWMKSGTAKNRKYIPVHAIVSQLDNSIIQSLIAFHAITGSDTTSYIAGHTKKTAWKVFLQNAQLLSHLGDNEITQDVITDAITFICRVYNCTTENNVDILRAKQFLKCLTPEKLPPTSNALTLHIKRSHYQALVWKQAYLNYPILPSPENYGWQLEDSSLSPIDPVPKSCLESDWR